MSTAVRLPINHTFISVLACYLDKTIANFKRLACYTKIRLDFEFGNLNRGAFIYNSNFFTELANIDTKTKYLGCSKLFPSASTPLLLE